MPKFPHAKYLRVIIFDDEPVEIVEAVSEIQEELAKQNFRIQIQVYRVDWYYQAQHEIQLNDSIPMLWLVDLHQKYQLDGRIKQEAELAIEAMGFDTRQTVAELTQAVATHGNRPDGYMAPDGLAIIALAKFKRIPFRIASFYSRTAPIRDSIAKFATGDPATNIIEWGIQKGDLSKGKPSRERLEATIQQSAGSPPAGGGFGEQSRKRLYKDLALWGLVLTVVIGGAALYLQMQEVDAARKQLEEARRQAERETTQPTYKNLKLTFTAGGKDLEWDLLKTEIPKGLPVRGQVNVRLLAELTTTDNHQTVMLYKLGAGRPQIIGPQRGRIDTKDESSSGWSLEPGFYLVVLHSCNHSIQEQVKADLVQSLKDESESLRKKVGESSGVFLCQGGAAVSNSIEGEGYNLLRGICKGLHEKFEMTDSKNNKVTLVAFQILAK